MKRKHTIAGLTFAAIACTTMFCTGVFAASTQSGVLNGSVGVTSYPHVQAIVEVSLDGQALSALYIEDTETKQVYTIEGFEQALADSFHGNVVESEDEGRIDVDDSTDVVIAITNNSSDYNLSYSIGYTETSLVNMSTTITGDESKSLMDTDDQGKATYSINVKDNNLSASGSYAWTISLSASNK